LSIGFIDPRTFVLDGVVMELISSEESLVCGCESSDAWMGGEGPDIGKRHCCVEYRGDFVLGVGYEMWDIGFGIGRIWKDSGYCDNRRTR
jgi:hypothetical protein